VFEPAAETKRIRASQKSGHALSLSFQRKRELGRRCQGPFAQVPVADRHSSEGRTLQRRLRGKAAVPMQNIKIEFIIILNCHPVC